MYGFPWWLSGKAPPAMQEAWVCPLGCENPLEKEMATRSSVLIWEIHGRRNLGGATVHWVTVYVDVNNTIKLQISLSSNNSVNVFCHFSRSQSGNMGSLSNLLAADLFFVLLSCLITIST